MDNYITNIIFCFCFFVFSKKSDSEDSAFASEGSSFSFDSSFDPFSREKNSIECLSGSKNDIVNFLIEEIGGEGRFFLIVFSKAFVR